MSKILYTIKLDVTEKWLQKCNDYQEMFSSIRLTPKQMLEVFKTNKQCLIQSLTCGFDTGEREWFQSLLSKKLIGIDWPCGMDSTKKGKYKNFFEKLTKAAKKEYIVL